MRTLATPGSCLDCALPVQGTPVCPRCGLPQDGTDAVRLRALLTEADTVLRRLDTQRAGIHVAASVTPRPRPAPPPRDDRRRRAPVSVGSVLLALGALCLVVAAVVFVAVTWGSLSLSARTLVLLGATAAAFAVTALLTARRLHGSVEAVSAVAWLFLAIDVAAARATGLFGLDTLSLTDLVTTSGLVAGVSASVVAVLTHRLVGREPYVTSAVAVAGWWLVGASVAGQWESSRAWLLVALVLAGAVLSLGYLVADSRIMLLLLAASTLLLHGLLWCEALRSALSADVDALLRGGALWPVLVTMALTATAAEGGRRRQPGRRADVVVFGAGLASTLLGVAVLVAPAWQAAPTRGVVVLCLVTLTLAGSGLLAPRPWTKGPRTLVPVAVTGCLLVASPWVARLGLDLATLLVTPWGHPIDGSLPGHGPDPGTAIGLPLWTASIALLGVAVTGWVVAAWQVVPLPVRVLREGSLLVVWAAGALTVSLVSGSLVIAVASLVLPGSVLLARGAGRQAARPPGVLLGTLGLAGGCLVAAASVGLSLAVWSGCLVVAVRMAARSPLGPVVVAWAAAAVTLGTGVTAAAVDLLEGGPGAQAFTLALVLALTLATSVALRAEDLRRGVVAGVAGMSIVPVLLALDVGLARTSLVLTLLGVAAAGVGIAEARRRPSALLGSLALAIAWWLRLAASDIDVVEAYTLLPAVVLLAVGLLPVLRRAASTVPTLLPGLTLAIAPSLPLTIADPGSLRGLLVMAAAVVLLAAGTMLRWAAPFLVGAVVVALVAVVHLGPYVEATPRWAALGVLGLAMLGVGVTWESRVHDLRSAVAYVGALR
ncbi:MAG: hypothetical protein M3419_10200 [Actinomycetota bacterium]|nr:hypothetical protein [Actinomycetota bacterium]